MELFDLICGTLAEDEKVNAQSVEKADDSLTFQRDEDGVLWSYDAAGKLATGTYTEEEWITGLKNEVMKQRVDQYTYELDARDRVVRTIVIPGDTMHLPSNKVSAKANYAQIISETTYAKRNTLVVKIDTQDIVDPTEPSDPTTPTDPTVDPDEDN